MPEFCSCCGYCGADRPITPGFSSPTIYNYVDAGKLRARRPAERYILREGDVAILISKLEGDASWGTEASSR